MPKMADRIQETTTSGGTGTITLAGAVTGYRTFAAGFTTGDTLFYVIDDGIGSWEIGIGTLVTTGTLSRDTVIASSNSNALVNFSSGTKRVFCSAPTRSLVPDQTSKNGYVLTTDGTDPSWTQTLNSVTIGNTTPAAGAFTTLSASSTVSGTGFSNYLASPPAIGGSSPAAGSFTNLTTSSTVTINGGTANGVGYLNASKVLTTGTALTFDGTRLVATATTGAATTYPAYFDNSGGGDGTGSRIGFRNTGTSYGEVGYVFSGGFGFVLDSANSGNTRFLIGGGEQMRLTSTGLGIGLGGGSPATKLDVQISGGRFQVYPAVTATGVRLLSVNTGNSATVPMEISGSDIRFTNSSNVLNAILDSSGNFGLGVTPSAWGSGYKAFQVSSTCLYDNGANNTFLGSNFYFDGSNNRYINSTSASAYGQNQSGEHRWYTAASGTAGSAISFTQAMTLTAAGDLLVGTTSAEGDSSKIITNGAVSINKMHKVISSAANPNLSDGTYRLFSLTNAVSSRFIELYVTSLRGAAVYRLNGYDISGVQYFTLVSGAASGMSYFLTNATNAGETEVRVTVSDTSTYSTAFVHRITMFVYDGSKNLVDLGGVSV